MLLTMFIFKQKGVMNNILYILPAIAYNQKDAKKKLKYVNQIVEVVVFGQMFIMLRIVKFQLV